MSFEKQAKVEGGKYAKQVQEMSTELAKHSTEKARLDAVIDTGCKHLQEMKTNGSTIHDVIKSLKVVVDSEADLAAAVKNGVK